MQSGVELGRAEGARRTRRSTRGTEARDKSPERKEGENNLRCLI